MLNARLDDSTTSYNRETHHLEDASCYVMLCYVMFFSWLEDRCMIDHRNTGGFNLSCRCSSERIFRGIIGDQGTRAVGPNRGRSRNTTVRAEAKGALAPETWACRDRLTWVRHTAENHDYAHGWFRAQSAPVVPLASPLTASHARPKRRSTERSTLR